MQEHFIRHPNLSGIFICEDGCVNLDDLLSALSAPAGGIVRVRGNVHEVIRYITDEAEPYQCVAGWISENA